MHRTTATITAHHLYLTSTEACCDPFAFCKPIPKKPTDRHALLKAVVSGNSKFFLYVTYHCSTLHALA